MKAATACTLALVPLVLVANLAGPGCMQASSRHLPRAVPPHHTGEFTTWWSDGRKKEEGTYLDGKRNGEVRGFHPDGSLAYEGTFERDVPLGPIQRYFPGGGVASSEVVRGGTLDGPRIEYYPSGGQRTEAHWVAGRKQGPERQWYEDGRLAVEGQWTAGRPTGHWRHWTPQGLLQREEHLWVTGGVPVGRLETVYGAPGVVSSQTLLSMRDGVWTGWISLWHGNGRQASVVEYRDDKRHGREVNWRADGRKLSEGRRVDDERDGLWTFYDEQGQVERTVRYVAGQAVPDDGEPAADEETAAGGPSG